MADNDKKPVFANTFASLLHDEVQDVICNRLCPTATTNGISAAATWRSYFFDAGVIGSKMMVVA